MSDSSSSQDDGNGWPAEIRQSYVEYPSFYDSRLVRSNHTIDHQLNGWNKTRGNPGTTDTSKRPRSQATSLQASSLPDDDERMNLEKRALAQYDSLLELHEMVKREECAWRAWWDVERSKPKQRACAKMHARYLQLKQEDKLRMEADLARQAKLLNFVYDDISHSPRLFRLLRLSAEGLTATTTRLLPPWPPLGEVYAPEISMSQDIVISPTPLSVPVPPEYLKTPYAFTKVNRTRTFFSRLTGQKFTWIDEHGRERTSGSDPRQDWSSQLGDFMAELDRSKSLHERYAAALKLCPESPSCRKDEEDLQNICEEYNRSLKEWRYRCNGPVLALQRELRDAISGSLHTFNIDDPACPHFEALSYEWKRKRSRGQKAIALEQGSKGHQIMKIGRSLYELLRDIQLSKGEIWVWADAICIDQDSPQERGHQVKLMGTVYTRADKVLAWVPLPNPSAAIEALKQLPLITLSARVRANANLVALDDLLRADFWTRKWIIQEVILARTLIILLGRQELPMSDLTNILQISQQMHNRDLARVSSLGADIRPLPVAKLAEGRRDRLQAAPATQSLSELLLMYEDNQCTVYQDHVYALYNLVGEHRSHLKIDYTLLADAWCEQVLTFLDLHEPSCRPIMARVALSVARLSGQDSVLCHRVSATRITVRAFDRGGLETVADCALSRLLRNCMDSHLHPGVRWVLQETKGCWHITRQSNVISWFEKKELEYFEIPHNSLCGLAAARIETGDHIWQFLHAKYAFVVRPYRRPFESTSHVKIVGRCVLFVKDLDYWNWNSILHYQSLGSVRQDVQSYDLRLNISDMYKIAFSADDKELPRYLTGALPPSYLARNHLGGL